MSNHQRRPILPWSLVWLAAAALLGWIAAAALRAEDLPAAHPSLRWEAAVAAMEERDKESPPPKDGFLFIGSSSIRMWDLEKNFPDLPVINRGFGGSQIADSTYFASRLVGPHRPRVVVLYAGDNDLAAGKSPEQVAADYQAFVAAVREELPEAKIVFIGVKPSIARWRLIDKVRKANRLIREAVERDPAQVFLDVDAPMIGEDGLPRADLLAADGLHLSAAGYRLWADLVRPHLK